MTRRLVAASRFPCRFVGEQQFWLSDKGAGDRHALLLAARELSGIMAQAMTQTDRGETLGGRGEGVPPPGEFERQCYVFECGHRRD